MTPRWCWLLIFGLPVATRAQSATPCPRPDSAFTLVPADTARGFRTPSPSVTILPAREFRGHAEVHVLVMATGRVLKDSTKVLGASSTQDSLLLASASAGFKFYAARYLSCSISAWFVYTVRRD